MKKYMNMAYEEARTAAGEREIPVGAVIVRNGEVIASARNSCIKDSDMTRHAEMKAIKEACSKLSSAYLTDCELYVTLEPCPMCMGAIINSRIAKLVYGADDFVYGACGGYVNLSEHAYAKKLEIYAGIMSEECSALLSNFMKELR